MKSTTYNISNTNHSYMIYHLILTVKYRRKFLNQFDMNKALSYSQSKKFNLVYIGLDIDHVHLLVESFPKYSISEVVKDIKQYSTYYLWSHYENILITYFWKRRCFWNSSYFVTTLGNVSKIKIEEYLENQLYGRRIPLPKGTII